MARLLSGNTDLVPCRELGRVLVTRQSAQRGSLFCVCVCVCPSLFQIQLHKLQSMMDLRRGTDGRGNHVVDEGEATWPKLFIWSTLVNS
jgi:hypothetical protein